MSKETGRTILDAVIIALAPLAGMLLFKAGLAYAGLVIVAALCAMYAHRTSAEA